jgi:hypothetical protein
MSVLNSIRNISPRTAGLAAMAAGAAFAAGGVVQLFDPNPDSGTDVVGLAGYLKLSLLAASLVLVAPGFFALARYARSDTGATAAAIGTTVLGVTCLTSIANGEDLALFNLLAPLTNAAWLFGSIALAVSLRRAGRVPAAVAFALPLTWVAALPLSSLGGGLLAGAYWIAVGYLLTDGAIERLGRIEPSPARA